MQALENGKRLKIKPKLPTAKISKIDSLGKVTITFSEQMMAPPLSIFKQISEPATERKLIGNFKNSFAANSLAIKVLAYETTDDQNLKFNYTVESFQNDTLVLQINFEKAYYVSQNTNFDSI